MLPGVSGHLLSVRINERKARYAKSTNPRSPADEKKIAYLTQFMNIYWLRPETALWRTLDCMALQEIEFIPPIVDVGCGDGLFSFTRGGGELSPEYDMFVQTENLESFFDKVDIYNHFDETAISPVLTKPMAYQIDLGLDHKEALLKKAFSLGCYNEVKTCERQVCWNVPLFAKVPQLVVVVSQDCNIYELAVITKVKDEILRAVVGSYWQPDYKRGLL